MNNWIVAAACAAAMGLAAFGGTSASAATLLSAVENEGGPPGNSGNDPFPDSLVLEEFGIDSPALVKCDLGTGENSSYPLGCDNNWLDGNAEGDYASAFTLEFTDANSFDWTFDPDLVTDTTEVLFPRYVAIKQSNSYELWELSAGESLGGSIDSLRNGISHVSFYDSMEVVPLPAAGWLLLGGLGGLYAMKRRKRAS